MKSRLGEGKFEYVWASVGAGKLITVHTTSRWLHGRREFCLYGNWKDSNQLNIDPAGDNSTLIGSLRQSNRDRHVIIANESWRRCSRSTSSGLKEAERVPVEEGPEPVLPDLFVPDAAFEGLNGASQWSTETHSSSIDPSRPPASHA
jgi:hypothetical protein